MICPKCGYQIPDSAKLCPYCGADCSTGSYINNQASQVFDKAEQELGSAIGEVKQSLNSNNNNNYQNNMNYQGDPNYQNNMNYQGDPNYQNMNYQGDPNYQNMNYQGDPNYQNNMNYQGNQNYQNGMNYANNPGNIPAYAGERLKDDRGLLSYILLSIITFGIYGYYFLYKMAHDVNIACDGDGEKTSGVAAFIILSFITCGIYAWVWYYKIGNRLAANAPRYGIVITENGTTVLMWLIFGMLICGIGPFVAMHILIKNSNKICNAYNRAHGLI